MRMRTIVLLSICVGSLTSTGCYLAHERGGDGDVHRDAGPPDVVFPDVAPDDAAPSCRARCDAAELAATGVLPAFASQGLFLESVVVSAVATREGVFGAILATWPDSTTESELRPTLFRVTRATGELEWLPFPTGLTTHPPLHGAQVRLVEDELRLVVMQTSSAGSGHDATVGRGTWSATSLALTNEASALLTAPFELVPSLEGDATVVGAGDLDLGLFADLATVHAFLLRGVDTSLVDLVALPDSGAREPLSAAILEDDRIVVVGGGVRTPLTPSRTPFMAMGRLEDAPLPAGPVIGARHDPPPLVVAEVDGFALARHVTNDADLLRSAIRVVHHSADATVLEEVRIPTTNGRRPLAMSLFSAAGQAGLAWTEHNESTTEQVDLRVLSPGVDRGCDTQGFDPVMALSASVIGLTAAGADDGSVYVVVVTPHPGPMAATVDVFRVGGCMR